MRCACALLVSAERFASLLCHCECFPAFFYANLQHLPFSLLLPGHKEGRSHPFSILIPLFYSSWFSQLKMSAEGESSTNHAVVPTGDAPETASTVDMDTNTF